MRARHGWLVVAVIEIAAIFVASAAVSSGQEFIAPPVGIPANTAPVSPTSPEFVSTALPVVPQVCRLSLEDARQRALAANRALSWHI